MRGSVEDALALAEAQVGAVRDDPAGRLRLMSQVFGTPDDAARGRLPYRRAALSFMRWQSRRGLLVPADGTPAGSLWWRAVNERLLRDGCEAVALLDGAPGGPSSPAVQLWIDFAGRPTGANWYRAHNASVVAGYLESEPLAAAEHPAERFVMNVVLMRVLYAHALAGAPGLALGPFAAIGRALGDPRLGMAGVFLSLRRVLPDRYPLDREVTEYVAEERRLGRILDYALIGSRLHDLYAWSADAIGEPQLLALVADGTPVYALPADERHVWERPPTRSMADRLVARATAPRRVPAYQRS